MSRRIMIANEKLGWGGEEAMCCRGARSASPLSHSPISKTRNPTVSGSDGNRGTPPGQNNDAGTVPGI
eukprot:2197115-Rhodomonas_salina.2